jgi:hypothetical protein
MPLAPSSTPRGLISIKEKRFGSKQRLLRRLAAPRRGALNVAALDEDQTMTKKTTPEKPPTRAEASIAGRALRTGKATAAQIRSMAGRIESERAAVKRSKKR